MSKLNLTQEKKAAADKRKAEEERAAADKRKAEQERAAAEEERAAAEKRKAEEELAAAEEERAAAEEERAAAEEGSEGEAGVKSTLELFFNDVGLPKDKHEIIMKLGVEAPSDMAFLTDKDLAGLDLTTEEVGRLTRVRDGIKAVLDEESGGQMSFVRENAAAGKDVAAEADLIPGKKDFEKQTISDKEPDTAENQAEKVQTAAEQKQAEEERFAAEKKKAEEEKAAAAAAKKKKAEEERFAVEKRKAEEERFAAEGKEGEERRAMGGSDAVVDSNDSDQESAASESESESAGSAPSMELEPTAELTINAEQSGASGAKSGMVTVVKQKIQAGEGRVKGVLHRAASKVSKGLFFCRRALGDIGPRFAQLGALLHPVMHVLGGGAQIRSLEEEL